MERRERGTLEHVGIGRRVDTIAFVYVHLSSRTRMANLYLVDSLKQVGYWRPWTNRVGLDKGTYREGGRDRPLGKLESGTEKRGVSRTMEIICFPEDIFRTNFFRGEE